MKNLLAILLTGTLLASAADAATLKAAASVEGSQIRLGDLFDGLEEAQAARIVGAAPAPGRSVSFDAPSLARIAVAHGVAWQPVGGADRLQVARTSVSLGLQDIQAALVDALAAAGAPAGLDVTLDNRTFTLFLPAGTEPTVRVENLAYDAARGRVNATLVAPATGPEQLRTPVGGRAIATVEVPVLNRRLNTGDVIAESDLDWVTLPRDRAGADLVTDAAALVGKTAKRGMAPNQPIRARDVRAQVAVQKGQLVTILLQSPTMTLTAQGRAMADGAAGEVIRVTNTNSSRVVEAEVAGPNLVTVQTGRAHLPAAPIQSAALRAN